MQVDDRSENTDSDGVSFVDCSTHNTVVVGDMRRAMGAAVIDYGTCPFDAVLGWTFSAGRIIEIDYDRKLLHVHDRLPDLHGYTRANVRWIDNAQQRQAAQEGLRSSTQRVDDHAGGDAGTTCRVLMASSCQWPVLPAW